MNARLPKHDGDLAVLSVGGGDIKLSFDPANPAERIRAARIVRDMLRRGYALLVQTSTDAEGRPVFDRAQDFREDTCEYILADLDPLAAERADEQERPNGDEQGQADPDDQESAPAGAAPAKRRGRPPGKRVVKAEGARAVAVARSAGG